MVQDEISTSTHDSEINRTDWPQACRYYDPLNTDAAQISGLQSGDTSYSRPGFPWYLAFTCVSDGLARTYQTSEEGVHEHGIFAPSVLSAPMTVIHVRQKRLYLARNTTSTISVTRQMWLSLLTAFDVLPSFLKLLHSNNGGTLSYTSYREKQNRSDEDSATTETSGDRVMAFHVGYKMGNWVEHESAIYAHHDFDSGRSVVLVLGTDAALGVGRVQDLLRLRPDASFFHVVQALHSMLYDVTEDVRWIVDYNTQDLEALTGIGIVRQLDTEPLKPSELNFNSSLQVAVEYTHGLQIGSTRLRLNSQAFLGHMIRYEAIRPTSVKPLLSAKSMRNLREACELNIELAAGQYNQIAGLRNRLEAQIEVTKTLMAQRDTRLNIDIAEAVKRDSQLMRGIAAVTMIFLPATFVATFFSMVFFHVGDEQPMHLMVDGRIWLYPAVTMPLTVGIAIWYSAWSLGWSWEKMFQTWLVTRRWRGHSSA